MTNINPHLKPLIESAILTLEQIIENKPRMAHIDLYLSLIHI